MKKNISKFTILPFLGLIPFFYACASTPANLRDYSPVAVMTVYSNPSVPWFDEKSKTESVEDGILSGAINRLINKKNPETEKEAVQERIDYAGQLLSARIRDFGMEAITPESNPDCSAYKNAGKTFSDYLGNTVPAAGYEAIASSNGKMNRMICKETGAKSVIYVNFRFQKVMVKDGVRNTGVAPRVAMTVFATDNTGKKIISKEYSAISEDYTDLIKSSEWDKEKVVSQFPALSDKVITQFLSEFSVSESGETNLQGFTPTEIKIKSPAKNQQEDAVLTEKKATAKKLLEHGMTPEEAAEITGLSIEEVESLKE